MARPRSKIKRTQKQILCSDAKWEEIRERSVADGYRTMATWLVERSLRTRPSPADTGQSLGLTGDEGRELLRNARTISAALTKLDSPPEGGEHTTRQMLLGIFQMLQTLMAERGKLPELRAILRDINFERE